MKIGIITLYGNTNHGNKLQNYALISSIKKINSSADVYTIRPQEEKISAIRKVWRILKDIKGRIRSKKISSINKYLNYIEFGKTSSDYFDCIVVGSDQIWNYKFPEFEYDYAFGKKYNCRKISYAASIGVNHIDDLHKKIFYDSLSKYNYISVREDSGKTALKEIGIDNVDVVLDPTLLLSVDEWSEIENKSKISIPKKYIFKYFIGNDDIDLVRNMERYAKDNGYEIVDILDRTSRYYKITISDFLRLVHNSSIVCTNSFHACVFSIIYNKAFVFSDGDNTERKSMSSRTDTLLKKFRLEDRRTNDVSDEIFKCDFDYANRHIESLRRDSYGYLENALLERSD